MISFLVDQNFNEHIVDGLTRRDPNLEFTYARDVGLAAAPDPEVLEWAAGCGMIVKRYPRLRQIALLRVYQCPAFLSFQPTCRSDRLSLNCSSQRIVFRRTNAETLSTISRFESLNEMVGDLATVRERL